MLFAVEEIRGSLVLLFCTLSIDRGKTKNARCSKLEKPGCRKLQNTSYENFKIGVSGDYEGYRLWVPQTYRGWVMTPH